jgi:hypothetical protein
MASKETTAPGRGRPTAFKPEFTEQARKLALLGATDREVADFFKVDERTVNRWKHTHEDFCQSLKIGKDAADDRVERSLYHKAVGYTFPSEKLFCFEGVVTRADIVEHVPPSDTAAIFWLKNRRGDDWREKSEVAVTGDLADMITARRQQVIDGKTG